MDQELADAAAAYAPADALYAFTRRQHYSAWNDVTAAILKYDVISEIGLRQSMRI